MTSVVAAPLRVTEHFVRWWATEILDSLPRGLRTALTGEGRRLVLVVGERHVEFRRQDDGQAPPLAEVEIKDREPAEVRAAAIRLIGGAAGAPNRTAICLPSSRILRRTVDLPLATIENLREVLAFEMDRYSPFDADQVYYDFRVVEKNPTLKRIRVDLAVVRRQVADQALGVARAMGLQPTTLGVIGHGGDVEPFQFLPSRPHGRPRGLWRTVTAALAVLFVILAGAAIYLPIKNKMAALAAGEADVARLRIAAAEADRLREQAATIGERGLYVLQQRRLRPARTEIVNELTELIPDDTWLTALTLDGDRVALSGYSPKASALIAILEESPLLADARFTAAVAPDARFSLERFSLTARVVDQIE